MRKLIAAIALSAFVGIAGVQAQTYPSRSITIVVPFPPGGSTDVAARIMADRMRPLLGQSIIIENVGGAGGSIAVGRVARAAPDGYTIDIGQWDTHFGAIIYPLNYDLQAAFEPIGLISVNPQLLLARKTLPADDLKGLLALLKANPGKTTFVNQNAAAQISGLLLQQLTGTEVQFIPYRGAGPAMTDLVAGQVDLLVVQGAAALPQVRGGTAKAIANLSPRRSASMPDIPTADEGGVPGLYMSGWFGFFAPKGTPKDVVARLNDAIERYAKLVKQLDDLAAMDELLAEETDAELSAELKPGENLLSRSMIRNCLAVRNPSTTSVRLRATCFMKAVSGEVIVAAMWATRVASTPRSLGARRALGSR
jgi:tripartite-type tricarboxylate transporter receptor subunit TctC